MDAAELHLPDGKPSGVFICGKCRHLTASCHSPIGDTGGRRWADAERVEYARKQAEKCCNWTCETCGKPARQFYALCDDCLGMKRAADERAKEAAAFEQATKLNLAAFGRSDACDNMLYDARIDKWHRNLDEAEEWYAEDEERTRPVYLWLSEVKRDPPNLEDRVSDYIGDNFHEDAAAEMPAAAWKELSDFEDQWWEKYGPTTYEPDPKRCVLLGPPETPA
jgi:hypothetical protein